MTYQSETTGRYCGTYTTQKSYLRVVNSNAVNIPGAVSRENSDIRIDIVGVSSGTLYGTFTYTVPPGASPQFSVEDIIRVSGADANAGNECVAFYMRSFNNLTNFQHIVYDNETAFFENLSMCKYESGSGYTDTNPLAINVHTSLLSQSWPSFIYLTNMSPFISQYTVNIHKAGGEEMGKFVGSFVINLDSNSAYRIPHSYFEDAIEWSPSAELRDYHMNLIFYNYPDATISTSAFFNLQIDFIKYDLIFNIRR